jgi:GT2 family glycosyltransferase
VSISIVIPTHDREEKLRNLLSSIRSTALADIVSVVVVDDSEVKPDLSEFQDIGIQHIYVPSRVFISRAKNIGWRRAKGEFVYFIDDDNVVDSNTFVPVKRAISSDSSVGAVMPAVFYRSRPDLVWVYATPFEREGPDLRLVGRNLPRNPSLENRLLGTDALPNASMVRRSAVQQIGGFDERLVVNSSLDFAQRLKARGWKVMANTGASIKHDVEPPGQMGWWAAHGSVDPARVRYELRDWFLIMKGLRPNERAFRTRSILRSLRFVVPNAFAYALRGRSRRRLLAALLRGYAEGLSLAG